MSSVVVRLQGWHPPWHTKLVAVSVVVVLVALALDAATPALMVVTTIAALVGGTGFVLGVSAAISAFFERDSYADSDFWR